MASGAPDNALRIAAPLLGAVMPIPARGAGVCGICHSSVEGYEHCFPCNQALHFLQREVPKVVPISLAVEGEQLHHALKGYKDDRDAVVRDRFAYQLAALSELFWRRHVTCIEPFDAITTVPSSDRNAFEAVVQRSHRLTDLYQPLLTRTGASGTHQLNAAKYSVARDKVEGRRIVLVDDTFTSGATVFSAARAIRNAGGLVDHIVVIGRYIKRSHRPSADLIDRMRAEPWDVTECVCCRPQTSLFAGW
ncbi:MAG TPA: hypothetical protein DCQ04_11900 [Actinobacteria bacterium]|nr:hypothetical protein [Actinomycetota bacterium]